jgi:hypothetical protein
MVVRFSIKISLFAFLRVVILIHPFVCRFVGSQKLICFVFLARRFQPKWGALYSGNCLHDQGRGRKHLVRSN